MALTKPLDYNRFRKALVNEVTKVTGLVCVLEEPETQNEPRPGFGRTAVPYAGIKFTSPGLKTGDDSTQYVNYIENRGGQREMVVDFNFYGKTHEDAYNYGALWQGALELFTIQQDLRQAGIAVWLNGQVADISQLLNTGYEGRAHIEVRFGIASNMTEDPGEITTVGITGEVLFDAGTETIHVSVEE